MGEESKLKLNVEVQSVEEATVVYCRGRLVYRDEVAALSQAVAETHPAMLVLDLAGVEAIDSAGLGELIAVLQATQARGGSLKLAAPNRRVRSLLQLTNLTSVLEVYPSLDEALLSWKQPA